MVLAPFPIGVPIEFLPAPSENSRFGTVFKMYTFQRCESLSSGIQYTESGQTLQGSFSAAAAAAVSAVSEPNFASEYSLESFRRDLHNALIRTVP